MRKSILLFITVLLSACFDKLPFVHKGSPTTNQVVAIQSDFHILAQRLQCIHAAIEDDLIEEHCASLSLISQKTNLEWLNQFLDSLTLSVLTETKSSEQGIEQLVQKWFNDVLPELEINQGWDYTREIHFIGQRGRLATFSVITSYYTGGAYGMYDTQFLNIDLIDKVIYQLDDLLISSDKLPALTKLLRDKNMIRLNELGITENRENDELQATNNFVFTINGLVFRYPVYALGSYAEGEIDLVLPYSQLKGIVKPELLH
ncbi:RsiV family protein [Pasteurella oralis]|uniref:RsiV family protein n=1 Tax=Pasteurella oralis TaxID=1071947 RepID=A0ABW4NVJ3_9PAST|nr:RsiV family protein [Pasteurella oralis]MDO5055465.1 RsiV family protein [Pasteurella oralis]